MRGLRGSAYAETHCHRCKTVCVCVCVWDIGSAHLITSFSTRLFNWDTHTPSSTPQHQGRAETFGGAGAQSIKGAHGTRLLIGLCCLLICVSKWMLLYWLQLQMPWRSCLKKKHRTEKTILSLNVKEHFFLHLLITLEWYYILLFLLLCLQGYGGFAVVNSYCCVVEKNIPVLFKIEFYSNPVLNLLIFWMIMIIKTGLISIFGGRENQSNACFTSVVIIIFKFLNKYCNNNSSKYECF